MKSIIPPIKTGNIWHSPLNVYWHADQIVKKVGAEAVEKKTEFQMLRDARVGAVVALCMFEKMNRVTYVQLYKPDPPDVILMQPSGEKWETRDITQVEVTTYVNPQQTLLEQLKRRKILPGQPAYNENYILAVNMGKHAVVAPGPISKYLKENKNVFPIWLLQEVSMSPDVIAKLTWINPGEVHETEVNLGKAAYDFKRLRFPDVIGTKRVGSIEYVRAEPSNPDNRAPWETVGD